MILMRQGVHVEMDVADLEASLVQVLGQVLGHAPGQGGDQDAPAAGHQAAALADQVVDLAVGRPDDADRIDQPGRANHLPVMESFVTRSRRPAGMEQLM